MKGSQYLPELADFIRRVKKLEGMELKELSSKKINFIFEGVAGEFVFSPSLKIQLHNSSLLIEKRLEDMIYDEDGYPYDYYDWEDMLYLMLSMIKRDEE